MSDGDHDIRTPLEMLKAILTFGELACVSAEHGYVSPSGKKPASKDVFQFPRHMMQDIEETITEAERETAANDYDTRQSGDNSWQP